MATVTKKKIRSAVQHSGPDGNAWKGVFRFSTNASGVFVDSDQTTAVVQTNVVRIGLLPAGLQLQDSLSIVSDAFSASTTCKLGFQYADGVDVATAAQDDDYFSASVATNALGRYRADNTAVAPLTLAKDAFLIMTVAGADHAAAGVMDVIVEGIATGAA